MRREVIDCDRCGAKACQDAQTIQVCVGYSSNGVENVADYERVDLCPKCLGVELSSVVKKFDDFSTGSGLEWVRKNTKHRK